MIYQIEKVSKDENGVIQEVLITSEDSRKEIISVQEVISRINSKMCKGCPNIEFYVDDAKVRVVKEHIATYADGKKSNNLDNLPKITTWNRIVVFFINLI